MMWLITQVLCFDVYLFWCGGLSELSDITGSRHRQYSGGMLVKTSGRVVHSSMYVETRKQCEQNCSRWMKEPVFAGKGAITWDPCHRGCALILHKARMDLYLLNYASRRRGSHVSRKLALLLCRITPRSLSGAE